jgi:protein phosphatase
MTALQWGAATDEGRVRSENEDAHLVEPLLFVVADGMGGHQAGEVASALAVQTLHARLADGAHSVDVVVAAVAEANAAIFHAAHQNDGQRGMGTTLTAIAVLPADGEHVATLALVNVGDSRTYRMRGDTLERITVDHSYVQELVATGHITELEARTHPRRNIVTRALGIEPTVRVDSWVLSMVRGDRFVLCSDGLVDEVPDHEIAMIAGGVAAPQAAADELVAMANRHGGRDNVTVIVVDVLEGLELAAADQLTAAQLEVDRLARAASASGAAEGGEPYQYGGRDADAASLTVPMAVAVDPVATTVMSSVDASERRRRLTPGVFLFLLILGLIVTVTITMVAVVLRNNDTTPAVTTLVTTQAPVTSTASVTTPTTPATVTTTASVTTLGGTTTTVPGGTVGPAGP